MRKNYEPDLTSVVGDFDFPVVSYLRGLIRNALTLTRTGGVVERNSPH